jgi:hypothetical protein
MIDIRRGLRILAPLIPMLPRRKCGPRTVPFGAVATSNVQEDVVYGGLWDIIFYIMEIERVGEVLSELGRRLRAARIERNDTMDVFAQRLGVSVGTVRAMERGAPTVQVGAWLNALWVLNQLDTITHVLEPKESLLERARAQEKRRRQRASRRSP